MFIPKFFKVTDRDEMLSFLRANNFGLLTSIQDGEIYASHIPFLLDDNGELLHCHLARANPQWQQLEGQRVMVAFPGPHDYISPSWYQSAGVPTWNYQALHVYGTCRVFDDPADLGALVNALTAYHESGFETPWQPDYGDAMLKGIVGIEITIEDLQCKYKLSQNRPAADHAPVVDQLEQRGETALAAAMRKTLDLETGDAHD